MEQKFRKYGTAPYTTVMVHGGPGAVGEMAEVAQKLSSDFGIVETLHRALTISDQIEELKDAIENETAPPVFLVGFSWGAWLSILFTAEYKHYVKKLILIGCGSLEAKHAAEIYNTRINRLNITDQQKFKTILDSLANQNIKGISPTFNELSALIEQTDNNDPVFSFMDKIEIHPQVFTSIWKEAEAFRKEGVLIKNLKQIDIPIHVIHGDYDPHPAAGIIEPLQEYKKVFHYDILQRCGHKPWIEKHARTQFFELISKIISE